LLTVFTIGIAIEMVHRNSATELKSSVAIPGGLCVNRFEVTFKEYDRFVLDTSATIPSSHGWGRGTRPVIFVSRIDALKYINWLNTTSARNYMLPSLKDWQQGLHPDDEIQQCYGGRANFNGQPGDKNCPASEFIGQTLPTGNFVPNSYGIFDYKGNVNEWTSTTHPDMTGIFFLTGGGWGNDQHALDSLDTGWARESTRDYSVGFRLFERPRSGIACIGTDTERNPQ
jgi:formylglycine-generating enzyme required for sulfatase activity